MNKRRARKDDITNDDVDPNETYQSSNICQNRMFKSFRTFLITLFPILGWLPYCFHTLLSDIIAGIYIGLYQIPQCIAYSIMAAYPLAHSIHTNIIASILYALIGANRRLSYGVFSLVSSLYVGIILQRISDTGSLESIMALVTFFIGICSLFVGILQLGSLIRFIPYEVLAGFRSGIYLMVITLQLSSMGGYKQINLGDGKQIIVIPNLFRNELYKKLTYHINWNSWIISFICLATLTMFRLLPYYWDNIFNYRLNWLKHTIKRIPVEFILVAIGFIITRNVNVKKYHIEKIDSINFGNDSLTNLLSHIRLEWLSFDRYFHQVWFECIIATVLFLMYMHSLALDFNIADTEDIHQHEPRNRKLQLNPKRMKFFRLGWKTYNINNEMITKGIIDCLSSFVKCLPCGASRIRSDRMRNVGACTQISSLVAGFVTLGLWLTLQTYLVDTPKCIIATIVAFDSLVAFIYEINQLRNFWKVSIFDVLVWLLTISSFILLNIEHSLYFSLGFSLIVYYLRNKSFAPFKFKLEKVLITGSNSVVLVPQDILDLKLENVEDGDDDSNVFKLIPNSTLKSVQIYKIDKRILTASNMDSFILDVCRKIASSMKKPQKAKRLIFDSRSLTYLDWPSIRLVKATVMRTIQVTESWNQNISSRFAIITDDDSNRQKIQSIDKNVLIVVFVFRTQLIQMIHNAGAFNIHFYHFLHRALHIGLNGAIKMVVSYPANQNDDNNLNENMDPSKLHDSSNPLSEEYIKTSDEKKQSKNRKQKKLRNKKIPGLEMQIIKPISIDSERTKNNEKSISDPVLPLSFKRQNLEHEFNVPSISEQFINIIPSTSKLCPRFEMIYQESLKDSIYKGSQKSFSSFSLNDIEIKRKAPEPPPRANKLSSSELSRSLPPPRPPPEPSYIISQPGYFKSPSTSFKAVSNISKQTNINCNLIKKSGQSLDSVPEEEEKEEKFNFFNDSKFKKNLESLFGG